MFWSLFFFIFSFSFIGTLFLLKKKKKEKKKTALLPQLVAICSYRNKFNDRVWFNTPIEGFSTFEELWAPCF